LNKIKIIFKDELKTTLRRKGFIITTLALPVLGILAILISQLVANIAKPTEVEVTKVGYVDRVGIFTIVPQNDQLEFVIYASETEANSALAAEDVQEYFIIPENYVATGQIERFSTKTELAPPSNVVNAIQSFLIQNLLQDKVSPDLALRVNYPANISTTVLDKSGAVSEGQGGFGALLISYIFGILLITSIFTASGYLLQGLSEEKENRIMEVLLSSVSTRQLVTGKVLALGVAGLCQLLVWMFSGWALLNVASSNMGGFFATLRFPPEVLVLGLVYFILGYFLYAILMAGVGAIAPTQRDGQQLSVIFTMMGAIPYFLMTFIVENGSHIVSRILTVFPFTAPLTVMMRINSGIPLWEIILSVTILILTICGSLLLVSKIFRVYLLMYGKTPGWKQILISLKQAGS
jgi:ABC-2 type transport system permease protein